MYRKCIRVLHSSSRGEPKSFSCLLGPSNSDWKLKIFILAIRLPNRLQCINLDNYFTVLLLQDSGTKLSSIITPVDQGDEKFLKILIWLNTLRPEQNDRHFRSRLFQIKIWNENDCIFVPTFLKYASKCPIFNKPTLVQIMARRQTGDKVLYERMVV